jgi:hypothetical protein
MAVALRSRKNQEEDRAGKKSRKRGMWEGQRDCRQPVHIKQDFRI